MSVPSGRSGRFSRLFWRMFSLSIVQIVVVAIAYITAFLLWDEEPLWRSMPERMVGMLSDSVSIEPVDPDRVQQDLDVIHELLPVDMAVYDSSGRRLASRGEPPDPMEVGRSVPDRRWCYGRGKSRVWSTPLGDDGEPRYYLASSESIAFGPGIARPLVALLTIPLVVAVFTFPLARRIVRPMESLMRTARRLASGDLGARSGLRPRGEVGVLARDIDEMASRLQHRIRGEKEMLANISHEIRTPLARIRVAQELCTEGESLEEIKAHLDSIGEDVTELEILVDDVLDVSRLDLSSDAGPVPFTLDRQKMDVGQVIHAAAVRFGQMHHDRCLDVQVPGDPPGVVADPALVRRVVDNLLDNAARYSDGDTVVEVAVVSHPSHVEVAVRDRGIGVPEEDLARLFEPFFRTDRSRTRDRGGTGLGLALCRRIVEAHGGSIYARNREGGGTVLSFTIPLDERPTGDDMESSR